jgi:integrase
MAIFKFVLWKYRTNKSGTKPVYLRITHNRKSRYVPTGLSVTEAQWNETRGTVRKSHPHYNTYNATLEHVMREAQNKTLELREKGNVSAANVKRTLREIDAKDFFAYAWRIVDNVKARGQYWHWKNFRATLNKFTDFNKQRTVLFSDITAEKLDDFETYLRKDGNNDTTINKRMKMLKRIFAIAIRHDVIKFEDNPFRKYKLPSAKSYKDNKLSVDEIERLRILKLPKHSPLWHAKNIFLFAYFASGVRFGDVCRLKWSNVQDGRLIYKMSKTGSVKNQKLIPQATEILKLYGPGKSNGFIFPLLDNEKDYSDESYLRSQISSKNAMVNVRLKEISELAEIKPVSFHASRHSFADFARSRNMSLYGISKSLGHTDLKTTQIYLKSLDTEATDAELEELWKK